jgi:hypothetical protein
VRLGLAQEQPELFAGFVAAQAMQVELALNAPVALAQLGKSCKTSPFVCYMSASTGILTGYEAKQP